MWRNDDKLNILYSLDEATTVIAVQYSRDETKSMKLILATSLENYESELEQNIVTWWIYDVPCLY